MRMWPHRAMEKMLVAMKTSFVMQLASSILAASVLLLLPQVAAGTSVTATEIGIDPRDLLLNKAGAKVTVTFTPTTVIPAGGYMHLSVGSFYQTDPGGSSPATMLSCSVPQLSVTFRSSVNQQAFNFQNTISMRTSSASIASNQAFTITIGNLTVGSSADSVVLFYISTSADTDLVFFEKYDLPGNHAISSSPTTLSQISVTIAESDRVISRAAAVTIQFTPSTTLGLQIPNLDSRLNYENNAVFLWYPKGFFRLSEQALTFKSSISNAYLERIELTSQCLGIRNVGGRSESPTGAPIPAGSPCTITIFGLVLNSPVGNIPNSMMITTSRDPAANVAVDSGSIGLGSYVKGSCPYGMTWSNALKACTSCSVTITQSSSSNTMASGSPTGLICDDFTDCLTCTACPYAQAIFGTSSGSSFFYPPYMIGPPSNLIFYACSNSTSRCPPGSGKQLGDNGGCSPCPYDTYNDGSSDRCQHCPAGTFPNYSVMKASVQLYCSICALKGVQYSASAASGTVQTGYVMKKSATSCSSQCPVGTGVLSDIPYLRGKIFIDVILFGNNVLQDRASSFIYLLGSYTSSTSVSSGPVVVKHQKDKGCLPCLNWFISKGNTCVACNEGASDRASLNTMGDSFTFASRCIPDICPWPYVPPGALGMNTLAYENEFGTAIAADAPPYPSPYSSLCQGNVHLGGTVATISVIAVILLGIYAVSISFAAMGQDEDLTDARRRKLVVGMLMTTVSPAIDFISDLMYIVSTLFFNDIILIVCCGFYLLPMFFFWRMLVKHGVQFSFYIGKPPAFAVMDKYDSIPKALLGLVGYVPLYIINLPISLPLFLVGHVLYCCKVFPISRVSNMWLRLYTRSDKHTSSVVIIIPLLQESIFEEMLTESVPQMVIQIVNNTFTNVWSPLSYFSTAMSAVMILNGIWRLVYYRLYLNIKIDAIPTGLSNDVFNFKSIEEGESPMGRSLDAKVAPELELSTIVSAMTESDEFSPLIQRHVKAEVAALKSAFMDETNSLKSEIQEINKRSLRMEAQLQELISRAGAT